MKITHFKQEKRKSCVPACFKMLFGGAEADARKLCMGNFDKLFLSIKERKPAHIVHLNIDLLENAWWLKNLTEQYPVVVCGVFRSNWAKCGRDSKYCHAFILYKGFSYDPNEQKPEPIDCINHTFNKSLTIKSLIIIEDENEDFGNNKT